MERKAKQTSKAKIDKMVADGARNYPAYLKLIYTGESELSSEDEYYNPHERREVRISTSSPIANYSCRSLTSCFDSPPITDFNKTASPGSESTKLKDEGREKFTTSENYDNDDMAESNVKNESFMMEKELHQIQEEIVSLKSILETKIAQAIQLKKKLGLTPISEFKLTIRNLKHSETFMKTNAALRSLSNLASKTFLVNWRITSPFKRHLAHESNYIKQSKSLGNMYEQSDNVMHLSSTSLKLQTIE